MEFANELSVRSEERGGNKHDFHENSVSMAEYAVDAFILNHILKWFYMPERRFSSYD